MKAWTVRKFGSPSEALVLGEAETPGPAKAGEVIVDLEAAGLNFADTLSVQGRYQIKPDLPFIPGIEAVGRVRESGQGSAIKVGQRVIVAPQWGAFAQSIGVDASRAYPVPDAMDAVDAAAFLLTYQTAYFALAVRARLQPDEHVLVHNGAGGVGTAAIQVGKAMGAHVMATAGGATKLEVCRQAGADVVVDYREDDFVDAALAWTNGRGVDVVYDSVGGDVADRSLKAVAFEARHVVVGFAGGTIPQFAANRIMLKNIAVVGLNWGAYRDQRPDVVRTAHDELVRMYTNGQLSPVVSRTLPLEELIQAMDALSARETYGKVVLTIA